MWTQFSSNSAAKYRCNSLNLKMMRQALLLRRIRRILGLGCNRDAMLSDSTGSRG